MRKHPSACHLHTTLKGKSLSSFQANVNDLFTNLSPSEILDNFEKHIVECAKKVALTQKRFRPDWFFQAERTLMDLISKRNEAFKNFKKNPSEENNQS